jgi:hypothetical protein
MAEDAIDREYLDHWINALGLQQAWDRVARTI